LEITPPAPNGIVAIADMLKTNTNLTYAKLEGNNMGPEGASAIADMLQLNSSLIYLNLSWASEIGKGFDF